MILRRLSRLLDLIVTSVRAFLTSCPTEERTRGTISMSSADGWTTGSAERAISMSSSIVAWVLSTSIGGPARSSRIAPRKIVSLIRVSTGSSCVALKEMISPPRRLVKSRLHCLSVEFERSFKRCE
jgi:hypothetical protein